MEIIDCEQRSEEWFQARLGCVTGTGFSQVLNKKTGRKTYMMKLLAERMTGVYEDGYKNKFMEDGIERESESRAFYENYMDVEVQEVGFIKSEKWVGVSVDGLIGDDGTFEQKNPLASTHCVYLRKKTLPAVYVPQVQGGLWVTGRKYCHFISYHPDMVKCPKMFYLKVYRDEGYIRNLAKETEKFLAELAVMVKEIKTPF